MVLAFVGVDLGWTSELGNSMLDQALDPQTAAVAVAVIGLNIHFGFTGLLNMGQAGFMLLGAYGFAISIVEGVPLVFAIIIGLAASGLFAVVLGVPTLKLRGDYLAIVTISAAEIVRYVGRATAFNEHTGGPQGIEGQDFRGPVTDLSFFGSGDFNIGSLDYILTGANSWWMRAVAWTVVALCVIVVWSAGAQPVGPTAPRRPGGRGRHPQPRQERLRDQDAGARARRPLRRHRRHALRAALVGRPRLHRPHADLLLLDRAPARRCGNRVRPGARVDPVLRGADPGDRDRRQHDPDSYLNTQQAGQFGWIVIGVALMLLVIFRPQGVLGDKRELRFNV